MKEDFTSISISKKLKKELVQAMTRNGHFTFTKVFKHYIDMTNNRDYCVVDDYLFVNLEGSNTIQVKKKDKNKKVK